MVQTNFSDPWDDAANPQPESFATGYSRGAGEGLVYGGGAVALGAILFSVFGYPLAALLAIGAAAVAIWFYPTVLKEPQIGGRSDGLFVDGIGFIDWASITEMSLHTTAVRSILLTKLHIRLNTDLQKAVSKPQKLPFWRMVMMKNWVLKQDEDGMQTIIVNMHTLRMPAEQVLSRLRRFRSA
ncbi:MULTISPECIES: hypothetical protein [Pseudovibrio]|uniref:hypothetical protein n=1 Tax=Stappiaceae TaxID=2821832 RepID=UPI002366C00B|nr:MULTISPECIES: hypothetical protein [Pseudovibrio]MDD7911201.1 hypothetical protein [Pseudovibrio exalbescens]MDX5593112.1 hypothetical protein [Pseudovibrio sp. SPO723]